MPEVPERIRAFALEAYEGDEAAAQKALRFTLNMHGLERTIADFDRAHGAQRSGGVHVTIHSPDGDGEFAAGRMSGYEAGLRDGRRGR